MGWFDTNARRTLAIALALGGCTASVPEAGLQTAEVHDEGLFEVADQNATEAAGGGDDWATVNAPGAGGGGSSTDHTGVLPDAPVLVRRSLVDSTTFTGGSKDDEEIGEWRHTSGTSPDKDEITNAYAASYVGTTGDTVGDHIVYFGMDRIATSGTANMGFWFLQSELSLNSNGTFDGEHTVGDILVQVDYSNGGSVPTVRVLEWVGSGGDVGSGTLALHTEDSADCANMDTAGQDIVCATTNPAATASPWNYVEKGETADGDFPAFSFVEGGINISEIFAGGTLPCFASFVAVTRASDSVTAALHDFVMGEFQSCGVDIEKTCNAGTVNAAGTGVTYTYTLTVENTGSGTLQNVTVSDSLGTCTPALGNIGSLAGGASVTLNCSFSSTDFDGLDNTASVTAGTGGTSSVTDEDTDFCEPPTITRGLTLNKVCAPTTVEVVNNRVSVVTSADVTVCNTGNVALSSVSVTDDCGTATDASAAVGSLTPAGTPDATRCATRRLTCRPNETSSTDPANASFPDRATGTGTAALGGETVNSPAMSTPLTCFLCPQIVAPQ